MGDVGWRTALVPSTRRFLDYNPQVTVPDFFDRSGQYNLTADPYGLNYGLEKDVGSEYAAYRHYSDELFPNEPALTSCWADGFGPRMGNFPSESWFIGSTTSISYEGDAETSATTNSQPDVDTKSSTTDLPTTTTRLDSPTPTSTPAPPPISTSTSISTSTRTEDESSPSTQRPDDPPSPPSSSQSARGQDPGTSPGPGPVPAPESASSPSPGPDSPSETTIVSTDREGDVVTIVSTLPDIVDSTSTEYTTVTSTRQDGSVVTVTELLPPSDEVPTASTGSSGSSDGKSSGSAGSEGDEPLPSHPTAGAGLVKHGGWFVVLLAVGVYLAF